MRSLRDFKYDELNDLGSRATRMFDKDVDSALTEALKKNGRNINTDPHQHDQRDEEEFDLSQMESEQ